MALFKRTFTRHIDGDGRQVSKGTRGSKKVQTKSVDWYGRYRDGDGIQRTVRLCSNKTAAQTMLNDLIRQAEREKAGLADGKMTAHAARPLSEHLGEFCDTLRAKNNTEKHIRTTRTRLESLFGGCGFRRLIDMEGDKASRWLRLERDAGRLAVQTTNYYIAAAKQFGRWVMESDRLARNPFAGMTKLNAAVDRRVVRRALTDAELSLLIDTTAKSGREFRELAGEDRAMLYAVAAFTGLRAGELASLTLGSIDLDNGTVVVEAAYSKRRRQDELPLHPSLIERLAPWLAAKRQGGSTDILPMRRGKNDPVVSRRLFPGSWSERSAQMIRADLTGAGIPIDTADGSLDFHGLRHTFCTRLAKCGISPKEAQTLARHSSITLTMDRYSHLQRLEIDSAMRRLPDLPRPATPQAATGTDGGAIADNRTPSVTRIVTRPTDKTCDGLRTVDATERGEPGSADPGLTARMMRNENDCERLKASSGGGIRTPDTRIMIPLSNTYNICDDGSLRHDRIFSDTDSDTPAPTPTSADPALAELIASWPTLSAPIRQAIMSLVRLR